MKYYSVTDIVKVIEELIRHGWGEIVIHVQDHKIPRYDKKESHKPEEKEE